MMLKMKKIDKAITIVQRDSDVYIPGEGMMGCWFRKGCVSVGIWLVGVFALKRPDTTGALAVAMVGLGSLFSCVG